MPYPPKPLVPGQYQVGPLIIGTGTNVRLSGFDPGAEEVANQDFQLPRSDQKQFGVDQLVPSTMDLTFNVLKNYIRPNAFNPQGITDEIFANDIKVEDLHKVWRFDEGRKVWGEMMALYRCGADGVTRAIYGRPGNFHYEVPTREYAGWVQCEAQFRRADTLCYSADESVIELTLGEIPDYLTRLRGNMDTWMRILIEGPVDHPVITIGEEQIELDWDIAEGETVEISSYPWQRRVVDSERRNLRSLLIGRTQYLDRLLLPVLKPIPVRWTATNANTFVPALGNQSWHEDINETSWFNLPPGFTTIGGKPVVRFDLFNVTGPQKFLGSGIFGTTSACIYTEKKFNTADQYMEARIVEPWGGRSAQVLMCNEAMTSGVACDIHSHFGNNRVQIRAIDGSYDNLGPVLAEYVHPYPLWNERDRIGIGYDPETNTFTAYKRWEDQPIPEADVLCSWIDSGNIIPKGTDNRSAGYIFDIDGMLVTFGTGFGDMICFDRAVVEAPVGRVALLWRDAWSTIV